MMNCTAGGIGVMWVGFLKRDYGLGTAFGGVSATVAMAGIVVLLGYFLILRQDRHKQREQFGIPVSPQPILTE
jgi:hypothetical protein